MAHKGETKCLKTNNARSMSGVEKTKNFLINPLPGKHNKGACISLGYVLRDLLLLADNEKEIKFIINNREVLVDKKKATSHRLPVGLFDVIEIPKINKIYKIVYATNGSYVLKEIDKVESNYKILKIISKKILGKDKVQLSTNDGRIVITTNIAYKPKASIKLDLEEGTIKEYFPLEAGREVFVIGGKHIGYKAKITEVKQGTLAKRMLIKLKSNDVDFETVEKNVIVVN